MGLKQQIIKIKWKPAAIMNELVMKARGISCGEGFVSYGTIFFRGGCRIKFGNNVTINSCREMNPIGGDTKTIFYIKKNGKIDIGNDVGISNSSIVALNKISIEDYVMIGADCKIYDHDFHSLNFDERIISSDLGVKSIPVLIKRGAFIGAHSIILKGVTIGEKSIVGAGSVVTMSIPDGEIWAGNPAKFIRKIDEV